MSIFVRVMAAFVAWGILTFEGGVPFLQWTGVQAKPANASTEDLKETSIESLVEKYTKALERSDWQEIRTLEKELIEVGEPAIEPLIPLMKNYESSVERVMRGIGPAVVEPLLIALEDKDNLSARFSRNTLKVAEELGEPALEIMIEISRRGGTGSRIRAVKALEDLGGEQVLDPLMERFNDEDKEVRFIARRGVGRVGPPAVDALLEAFEDMNHIEKESALFALGILRDKRAMPFVYESIDDAENSNILTAALYALDKIGPGEEDIPLLREVIHNTDHPDALAMATYTVGTIGNKEAKPLVHESIWKSEDSGVLGAAFDAIDKIGPDKEDIPLLSEAIHKSQSLSLLDKMYTVAVKIDDEKAFEALVSGLENVGLITRRQMIKSFAANHAKHKKSVIVLQKTMIRSLKDTDLEIRRAASRFFINEFNPQAIRPLAEALDDPDLRVRRSVSQALADHADQSVLPYLIEALEDTDLTVQAYAAKALGNIKNERAVSALTIALKTLEGWPRGEAAYSLARIGDPRSVGALMEAHDSAKDPIALTLTVRGLELLGKHPIRGLVFDSTEGEYELRHRYPLVILRMNQLPAHLFETVLNEFSIETQREVANIVALRKMNILNIKRPLQESDIREFISTDAPLSTKVKRRAFRNVKDERRAKVKIDMLHKHIESIRFIYHPSMTSEERRHRFNEMASYQLGLTRDDIDFLLTHFMHSKHPRFPSAAALRRWQPYSELLLEQYVEGKMQEDSSQRFRWPSKKVTQTLVAYARQNSSLQRIKEVLGSNAYWALFDYNQDLESQDFKYLLQQAQELLQKEGNQQNQTHMRLALNALDTIDLDELQFQELKALHEFLNTLWEREDLSIGLEESWAILAKALMNRMPEWERSLKPKWEEAISILREESYP